MTTFTASVDVAVGADVLWARITDWPAHSRWIPLTTVWVLTERPDGVGARFVGRTGLGPLGFDDPMEVVEWRPPAGAAPGDAPGFCRVRKLGAVVLGGAHFEVTPTGLPGAPASRLSWTEEVEIAPTRFTGRAGPVIAAAGRIGFTRVLRTMARELEAEQAGG
jgi:Polyketide cyclase / dehydrase and lipid transport